MATFDDVRRIGTALPEVVEATWFGTPSLKVRTKSLCRLWGARDHDRWDIHDTEVLVVMCDVDEKPLLIEGSEGVLFETPHYRGYGAVLVRLSEAPEDLVEDLLEEAYRLVAPKTLIRRLDAEAGDGP